MPLMLMPPLKAARQQRVDSAIMAAIFFVETQTIDLGAVAKQEANEIRDSMFGYIGSGIYNLEQAIQREIMNWSAPLLLN